jgi:hypothetical protein
MRTVNILASGITAAFGELVLMEAPAIDLFASFDWGTANLYTESFGKDGTEGRLSESANPNQRGQVQKGSGSINPMFRQEFGRLCGEVESADAWEREVRHLDVLTPGDFAVAARQYELWDSVPTAGELYEQLRQECVAKGAPAHPIGFAV